MKIIVDTNKIIAALIKDSACRKILLSEKIEFLTVDFTKRELNNHKNEMLDKVCIKEAALNSLMAEFLKRIYVIDDIAIKGAFEPAKRIMEKIDPDDTPFIALALSVENDGIWIDDKHFKRQKMFKIWTTADMLKLIE